jgi:hypothetical protein
MKNPRGTSSRLFDLNGEANRVRKKHNRVIIAADVRRFGHVSNKDGVLGTHKLIGAIQRSVPLLLICFCSLRFDEQRDDFRISFAQ